MSFVRNFRRGVLVAAAALFAGSFATSASAQMELKIIAPAAPGGGWDQTARSMQQALIAEKLVKNAQVINIAGAGGTIGLAQFVNGAKGDGNQLMVNGFVMVGAILLNKSPVSMSQITPIARITEETQVMVVPANSPPPESTSSTRPSPTSRSPGASPARRISAACSGNISGWCHPRSTRRNRARRPRALSASWSP